MISHKKKYCHFSSLLCKHKRKQKENKGRKCYNKKNCARGSKISKHMLMSLALCRSHTHANLLPNSMFLSPGVFKVRSSLEVKFGINQSKTSVIRARNINRQPRTDKSCLSFPIVLTECSLQTPLAIGFHLF